VPTCQRPSPGAVVRLTQQSLSEYFDSLSRWCKATGTSRVADISLRLSRICNAGDIDPASLSALVVAYLVHNPVIRPPVGSPGIRRAGRSPTNRLEMKMQFR
jgi:hypothetical protein